MRISFTPKITAFINKLPVEFGQIEYSDQLSETPPKDGGPYEQVSLDSRLCYYSARFTVSAVLPVEPFNIVIKANKLDDQLIHCQKLAGSNIYSALRIIRNGRLLVPLSEI